MSGSGDDAHMKLDRLVRGLAQSEERDEQIMGAVTTLTAAVERAADALGTLVTEVAELSKAAREEPKSDIGEVLRELTAAVEANTKAVQALVALQGARRGPQNL